MDGGNNDNKDDDGPDSDPEEKVKSDLKSKFFLMMDIGNPSIPCPKPKVIQHDNSVYRYIITGHGNIAGGIINNLSQYRNATIASTVKIGEFDKWGNEAKQMVNIMKGKEVNAPYVTTDSIPEANLSGDDK